MLIAISKDKLIVKKRSMIKIEQDKLFNHLRDHHIKWIEYPDTIVFTGEPKQLYSTLYVLSLAFDIELM